MTKPEDFVKSIEEYGDNYVDELDQSSRIQEMITDRRIAYLRFEAANINTSNPSGLCWSCDEEIGQERRWCDKACCEDWEREHG